MINNLKNNKRGFTLIELIVVIAIIGVLVLLATPKFLNYIAEARELRYAYNVKVVEQQMEIYQVRGESIPNIENWSLIEKETLEQMLREGKVYSVDGNLLKVNLDDKLGAFIFTTPVYADELVSKLPDDIYKIIPRDSELLKDVNDKETYVIGEITNKVYYVSTKLEGLGLEVEEWKITNVEGVSGNIITIAYGNNTFIAREGNNLLKSSNGLEWQNINFSKADDINSITFGDGKFVAVGNTNIFTSVDGITWVEREKPTNKQLLYVTYGNGKFLAIGMYETILSSDNGEIWVERNESINPDQLESVVYGDGKFVAVGNGKLMTSIDGISWKDDYKGISLSSITYGNGKFIGISYDTIYYSTDGINWSSSSKVNLPLSYTFYSNGVFIVVGNSETVYTSIDGVNWVERHYKQYGATLKAISYGNDKYIVGGTFGKLLIFSN